MAQTTVSDRLWVEDSPDQHGCQPPRDRLDFGVAIMCALPIEATAVTALFEQTWDATLFGKVPNDSNRYSFGSIGSHNVVLAHMPGMGKVSAATVAMNLRASFHGLRLVLLVGVCGGVPLSGKKTSGELFLGDVVISTGVVQYDLGRRLPGNRFVRKDTPHDNLSKVTAEVNATLAQLQTKQGRTRLQSGVCETLAKSQQQLGKEMAFPSRGEDRLFRPDYLHKHHHLSECQTCAKNIDSVCDDVIGMSCEELECGQGELQVMARLRQGDLSQPIVHFGLVASGDTVMRSGRDRDEIAARDGVIALEMEAAGMWEIFRGCGCGDHQECL